MLSRAHEVSLFERNSYLGGHTNTIVIPEGPDAGTPVDTGFIVCNPRNYPNFYRLLDELGVARRDSDMSFGYFDPESGFGYTGPAIREFIRQPGNFIRPVFLRMAWDQCRFNRRALADLAAGAVGAVTLGEYARRLGVSADFIRHYLVPLAASIWSSPDTSVLDFPAITFLTFFRNHAMLNLGDRIVWQTVVGGSHAYIAAFRRIFPGRLELADPVRSIRRTGSGAVVRRSTGVEESFDAVVLGVHADEALALLEDPSPEERRALGAWRFHTNRTVLHTDTSVLPPRRSLWAAWNYCRRAGDAGDAPVGITYWMNRLQGLRTERDYCVTLNDPGRIDPRHIVYETVYTHPEYTSGSVAAQGELRRLNGTNRTWFCGAWLGYGFHEDGCAAGLAVARGFGLDL